jgi:hypothetical protein
MSSSSWISQMWRALLLVCAATLATGSTCAQNSPSLNPFSLNPPARGESSSSLFMADSGGFGALPSAPAAAQNRSSATNSWMDREPFRHLAFEVGGGFNAPTNDSSPYITWGGNFTAGAGYRFSPYLALMAEYQIIDDKLPGAMVAKTGARGGNAHIWSFTLDPVIDLFPKHANDIYVTGGGGFYRKMTNFTDPALVDWCGFYFCGIGVTDVIVGHFSSNQGGWNVGAGYTRRIAPDYDNGRIKLFGEARYLDVLNPSVSGITPNGLKATSVPADTKLVPVTLGVRF